MILLIESPDKLSLSMFSDFYQTVVHQAELYDMNALHSTEALKASFNDLYKAEDAEQENRDVHRLIKYKTKRGLSKPIPENITEAVDYHIRFDMYSTHLEFEKYLDEAFMKRIEEKWAKNIEKMNKA